MQSHAVTVILLLCFASLGLTIIGLVLSVREDRRLGLLLALLLGAGLVVAIAVPTLQKAESYLAGPARPGGPGDVEPEAAGAGAPATPAVRPGGVDLRAAEARGLVQVTVTGRDLAYLNLALKSRSKDPLEVTIPAGLIFMADSAAVQNMVVRTGQSVFLAGKDAEASVMVPAACINMERAVPASSDRFTLGQAPAGGDLARLLELADFQGHSFRTQQFAIWTITDNPARDEYVGISSFGLGSGPDAQELQAIRSLFRQAGIDLARYRALRS